MTEPTHLTAEELEIRERAEKAATCFNHRVPAVGLASRQYHKDISALLDSLDAARRELAAKTELLANIKALGRVTMATESGRELIMKAITEVLAAPPSEHSEGKQEP